MWTLMFATVYFRFGTSLGIQILGVFQYALSLNRLLHLLIARRSFQLIGVLWWTPRHKMLSAGYRLQILVYHQYLSLRWILILFGDWYVLVHVAYLYIFLPVRRYLIASSIFRSPQYSKGYQNSKYSEWSSLFLWNSLNCLWFKMQYSNYNSFWNIPLSLHKEVLTYFFLPILGQILKYPIPC